MVTLESFNSVLIDDTPDRRSCLDHFRNGTGDHEAIFLFFETEFAVKALREFAWNGDAASAKRYAYLSALCGIRAPKLSHAFTKYAMGFRLLYPLLSGDKLVLHWHSQFQFPNLVGAPRHPYAMNPKHSEYHAVQIRLALARDWDTLVERSERFLQAPPKTRNSYVPDHRFYLALADGNVPAMEAQIGELLAPKLARSRSSESGWIVEGEVFPPWAVLLGKLAFHLGFALNIDHPKFPLALMEENEGEYEIPEEFSFLRDFDIFTPFKPNQDTGFSKDLSKLSPRRPGEPPLTFKDQCELMGIKL